MDFNTTGHKQRKGGRPGRSGVAGLRVGGESALEVRRTWISTPLATNSGKADGLEKTRSA